MGTTNVPGTAPARQGAYTTPSDAPTPRSITGDSLLIYIKLPQRDILTIVHLMHWKSMALQAASGMEEGEDNEKRRARSVPTMVSVEGCAPGEG